MQLGTFLRKMHNAWWQFQTRGNKEMVVLLLLFSNTKNVCWLYHLLRFLKENYLQSPKL